MKTQPIWLLEHNQPNCSRHTQWIIIFGHWYTIGIQPIESGIVQIDSNSSYYCYINGLDIEIYIYLMPCGVPNGIPYQWAYTSIDVLKKEVKKSKKKNKANNQD